MGCHHLTDAVAQQQVRLHPPTEPELRQGVSHREQQRLGGAGLVQFRDQRLLIAAARAEQLDQRHRQLGIQQGRHPFDRLLKHRLVLQQATGHAQALASLAGE